MNLRYATSVKVLTFYTVFYKIVMHNNLYTLYLPSNRVTTIYRVGKVQLGFHTEISFQGIICVLPVEILKR